VPSLGTLEDMLRKSPNTGISLYGGPFPVEWNLICEGRGSYTGGFDRWIEKGSSGGASLCEGFHEGDPGVRVPLLGNPKNGVFKRLTRFPVDGLSVQGGPVGEPGGGSSAGTF
jgi:hypothetical protein